MNEHVVILHAGGRVDAERLLSLTRRSRVAAEAGTPLSYSILDVCPDYAAASMRAREFRKARKVVTDERGVSGVVGAIPGRPAESDGADGVAEGSAAGSGVGKLDREPECPNCGSKACLVVSAGPQMEEEREQVQCLNCGVRGPTVPREFDGRETAWQAFVRVFNQNGEKA